MINYEDELEMDEEEFDDNDEDIQSIDGNNKCKSVSDHGKQEKQFNVSGVCFFNNTAQFNFEGPLCKT